MSEKIYVPDYTPSKYPCVVYNTTYLTAYRSQPGSNRLVIYDRYYLQNHYDRIEGSQQFGQSNWQQTCIEQSRLTSDFYYRHDLDNILISFIIIVIFGFYLPFSLFVRLFKRRV